MPALWEAPSLSANSERHDQRIEVVAGVYILNCRTPSVQWNVLWLPQELLLLEGDKHPRKMQRNLRQHYCQASFLRDLHRTVWPCQPAQVRIIATQ
jgi:hypothetical protein